MGQKANQRRLRNYTATDSGGFYGFITGLDAVLIVRAANLPAPDDDYIYVISKEQRDPVLLEKEMLRPFVFGRDVSRWHVAWDKYYIIFPYLKDEHSIYKLMPSKSYRERFEYSVPFIEDYAPKTWVYLSKFEEKLRKRVDGRYKKKARLEHKWYELFQTSYLNLAENPRALIQILAKRASTTIDTRPFIFQAGGKGGGLYGIMPSKAAPIVGFFVGIINSDIANFYFCQTSSVYSGGYYSYGDQFIKDLPIPPATEAQQTAIAGLAQTLTEKTAALRSLGAAVAAFPDSVTAARRSAGDVPDLEALERLASLQGLPREVSAPGVKSEHDLMGQVVLKVGKGV